MNSAVITLSVLFFTSVMLSITMTLAWRECGRPRHARTWAMAFGVASLQWIVNAVGVLFVRGPAASALLALVAIMVLATSALCVVGCRQRAGQRERWGAFGMAVGGAAALILVTTFAVPHVGARVAITNLFSAAMFFLCARSMVLAGRRPFAVESAMIAVFGMFALFETVLGGVAWRLGPSGEQEALEVYRMMIGVGLPAGYIATGVTAVLLLASDLSHQLRRLAASDPLTGILNRRGFEVAAERFVANARRHRLPITVAIADLDHFKSVNDRFGHAAGDTALRRFAALVGGAVRSGDIFARIGGEEFGLVLVGTSAEAAAEVLDRLRVTIAQMPIEGVPPGTLTASFGVAELTEGDEGLRPILARADRALYRAKQEGRNLVKIAGPTEPVADMPIGEAVPGFG